MWVKPPHARCSTKYGTGRVTGVLSEQAVQVNGIPRHVRDLRPRIITEDGRKQAEKKEGETQEWLIGLRHAAEPAQDGDEASGSEPRQGAEEVTESEQPRMSERERRPVVRFCCE